MADAPGTMMRSTLATEGALEPVACLWKYLGACC